MWKQRHGPAVTAARLIMAGVWLATAAAFLAPGLVLPERAQGQVRGPYGTSVGVMALVFAAFNLVRWWAARSEARTAARAGPNPLAPRRRDPEPYVPNPDLDFLRVPDAEKKE